MLRGRRDGDEVGQEVDSFSLVVVIHFQVCEW